MPTSQGVDALGQNQLQRLSETFGRITDTCHRGGLSRHQRRGPSYEGRLYVTNWDQVSLVSPLQPYSDEKWIEDTVRGVVDGKLVRLRDSEGEYIKRKEQRGGVLMHDVWHDINFIAPTSRERLGYPYAETSETS